MLFLLLVGQCLDCHPDAGGISQTLDYHPQAEGSMKALQKMEAASRVVIRQPAEGSKKAQELKKTALSCANWRKDPKRREEGKMEVGRTWE